MLLGTLLLKQCDGKTTHKVRINKLILTVMVQGGVSWFLPGPVGVEVWVGVDACVGTCVNVCVNVCVGLGLQVILSGLGVHWPSLPHTTVSTPTGTNPGSHWNTTTEPSVVLVYDFRNPLTIWGGGPQSAVQPMVSYHFTSNVRHHIQITFIYEGK